MPTPIPASTLTLALMFKTELGLSAAIRAVYLREQVCYRIGCPFDRVGQTHRVRQLELVQWHSRYREEGGDSVKIQRAYFRNPFSMGLKTRLSSSGAGSYRWRTCIG